MLQRQTRNSSTQTVHYVFKVYTKENKTTRIFQFRCHNKLFTVTLLWNFPSSRFKENNFVSAGNDYALFVPLWNITEFKCSSCSHEKRRRNPKIKNKIFPKTNALSRLKAMLTENIIMYSPQNFLTRQCLRYDNIRKLWCCWALFGFKALNSSKGPKLVFSLDLRTWRVDY